MTRTAETSSLDEHEAAATIRVEVIADEDVNLGAALSFLLFLVVHPDLLHLVPSLHHLLDVANDDEVQLLVLKLAHRRYLLAIERHQLFAFGSFCKHETHLSKLGCIVYVRRHLPQVLSLVAFCGCISSDGPLQLDS